jgi:GT2 family glycosyltransferase
MDKIFVAVLHHNNIDNIKTFLNCYNNNIDKKEAELFIIDNGSNSENYDILKSWNNGIDFLKFNLIRSEENTGVIGGRNLLFNEFFKFKDSYSGIMFLDDDQFITSKNFLNIYKKKIDSGFDLVGYESWKMNKNLLPKIKVAKYGDRFTYVGCGGMYIKKEVVESVGLFDEIFNPCYFEDPDYNFRCVQKGFKIDWIPNLPLIHKAHSTLGKRNDKRIKFRSSWELFNKKWSGKIPNGIYLI